MVFFHGSGLSYRSDDASLVCDFSVWWECFVETLSRWRLKRLRQQRLLGLATTQFALRHSIDAQHQWVCPTNNHTTNYVLFSHSTNSQQTNVLITFAFPFTTIDFFLELTDNQRQCVLIYQLDAVGVLAKGEHRHRVPGSLACPRGCAGSLGLRK